jgi:thiaminase/transcriptional activator TenA
MECRALEAVRALLPPGELDGLLARLAQDIEREPQALAELLTALGEPVPAEPWPACLGYASYVQACAYEGLLPGLAAIHAVERAYLDTWSAAAREVSPSSPWRGWVENWTSPAFRSVVDGIGAHLDELAGPPALATLDRLAPVYRRVALWEHAFWEMAWRGEGWPAGTAALP